MTVPAPQQSCPFHGKFSGIEQLFLLLLMLHID